MVSGRVREVVALGACLAIAWLAHADVLGLALVGWDSYPAVVSSRAASLPGALGDEWMGGRYPRGEFYRPASTLVLALDDASSGGTERGYQRGNLIALLAAAACVFGLARAWLGSVVAGAVGALVFALHAAQIEVVPVVARRSDLWCGAMMAAALWAQPRGLARAPLRLGLGAVLATLAVAFKESGIAVLAAIVAWHAADPALRRAGWHAVARQCLPALAGVAVFVVLRTAVLGGLGGHPDSSLLGGALAGARAAPSWLALLVMPQPWTESAADRILMLVLAAALALATLRLAGERAQEFSALAVWAVALLVLIGVSGDVASWYLVPLLGPYAVWLAALALSAWQRRADASAEARGLALGVAVLLISHLGFSPLLRAYPEWPQLSERMRTFLSDVDAWAIAQPRAPRLRLAGLPAGGGAPLHRIGVRSALGLTDYSVAAWTELHHPDVAARFSRASDAPDTLLIEEVRASAP